MDPSEMIAPVFGIAAAAAIAFYTVSFLQMSDKSFEDVGETETEADPLSLRSSQSNKEKRKMRKELKEQQLK